MQRQRTAVLGFLLLFGCETAQDDTETSGNGGSTATDGSSTSEAPQTTEGSTSSSGGGETSATTTGDGPSDATTGDDPTGGAEGSFDPGAPSCDGIETMCAGESCCTSIALAGGTYPRGCNGISTDGCYSREKPETDTTVSPFALDKYLVTVARFRAYMDAFNDGWIPQMGDGAPPDRPQWGWRPELNQYLGSSDLEGCHSLGSDVLSTYSPEPGQYEDVPVNCVNWYDAYAFCIWDGGRLATDAEWEFAATGGPENLPRPWGFAPATEERLGYVPLEEQTPSYLSPVGGRPEGNGVFGHADLIPFPEMVLDCATGISSEDEYGNAASLEPNPFQAPEDDTGLCRQERSWVRARNPNAQVHDSFSWSRQVTESMDRSFTDKGFRCARDVP